MVEISVLIPSVRDDKLLDAAVESVLSDGANDLELVVVFDGLPVTQKSWARDGRVKCISLPSRYGTPTALNVGIQAARGPFIARLDADDVNLPGRFPLQAAYLESNPHTVMVGSSALLIDRQGDQVGVLTVETEASRIVEGLLWRNQFIHSSIMTRRDALIELRGYNVHCRRMQDYEIILRMARLGEVCNIGEPLIHYRVHPGQHSRASPPWGSHTPPILRARRELARHMRVSLTGQMVRDGLWLASQFARHVGMQESGIDRHATGHTLPREV